MLETIALFANAGAAVFGVVAASYWLRAATVIIPPDDQPDADGWIDARIRVEDSAGRPIEVIETLMKQSRLNGRGALWGAIAASAVAVAQVCQVLIWAVSS